MSENLRAARRLDEIAALLEEQRADGFRVQAYRRAADVVAGLDQPLSAIVRRGGVAALEALPAVGPTIARGLRDLVATGRLPMLDRLRGARDPVALLQELPYIGPVVAERLHHEHGIGSLEELELALHEGRLDSDAWLGPKRRAVLRNALAQRLGRRRSRPHPAERPSVAELLAIDRQYRHGARGGTLPRIAPRRFNPERKAWLPVLHASVGGCDYTALFSNTARAHRLGRTHDWVVIYFDGPDREQQATVVTEGVGPLRGRRVVRGRETECLRHYGVQLEPPDEVLWFESEGAGERGAATTRASGGPLRSSRRSERGFRLGSRRFQSLVATL